MTQQAPDKINVFWFLPTHGDGRYLGTTEGGRPVDLPYLQQWRWQPTAWATTAC